jgi:hypothetical protein
LGRARPSPSCRRTRSKGLGNAAGMPSRHGQTIGISANCQALPPLPSLALPARMTLGNAAAAGVQLGHRQPIAIGVCAAHKKKEPRRWREALSSGTAPTGRLKKTAAAPRNGDATLTRCQALAHPWARSASLFGEGALLSILQTAQSRFEQPPAAPPAPLAEPQHCQGRERSAARQPSNIEQAHGI